METNTSNYSPIFQCTRCDTQIQFNLSSEDLKTKKPFEITCPNCGFIIRFVYQ